MKAVKTNLFRTVLALLTMLTLASSAHAWWNSDWTLRKKITLDAKAAGVPDAGGPFAVLVRLHDGDFQFGEAKDDGGDIRFVAADDKTPLTYHLEKFDPLLSEAFVWVKVDVKPGEPVSFWLYYGSAGPKAVNAGDSKGTYDSDTVLVYHFGEKGAPASDFTMGGGGAKNAGVPVEGSIIGGGVRLDGRNAIGIPNTPSLEWSAGGAVTLSLWVKPSVLTPNAAIFSRKEGANAFVVGADNGVPYVEINGQRSPAAAPLAVNSWHHLAVVSSGPKTTLYLDGETYATLNAGLPALNSPSWLGGSDPADTSAGAGFAGEIDELQISRAARSASYVKFTTVSQGGGDKAARLLSLGQDESPSSVMSWLSGGTFGVIIKSLTLDGWVVICVLAVMMVLSWFVMYNKVTYLNGISKGNALFLKEWKHVAADLTILDNADAEQYKTLGGRVDKAGQRAMRNASVYRIYHIGAEEIRHRLSVDKNVGTGGRKGLPGRSIHAIRAALDGGVVRETQKINKLIVLLTICISGGPFLGLLGTVVGVMITFAAVAAAGEVNVNAIAPGIAAALLATVAGLAVAIPSLFGYNYILSRVKDAKDDMHIFIDEFVTKMAEFYREEPFREGSD